MKPQIELSHLRALVAVAREGGASRAARSIGVSQSTISEHLLALERGLGVQLTVRERGRETTLSEAGRGWLPYAARVLHELDAAVAAVERHGLSMLRIGASESLGSFILPSVLSSLGERWPGLEVEISSGSCDGLREGVGSDTFDVALTLTPCGDARPIREGVTTTRVGPARLVLLARPNDALATGGPFELCNLTGRTVLTPDPDGEFRRSLETHLRGVAGISVRSAGSIGGVIAGIKMGSGLGVLPAYAVTAEQQRSELVEIGLQKALPAFAVEAVFLSGSESEPLRAVMDLLAERLTLTTPVQPRA